MKVYAIYSSAKVLLLLFFSIQNWIEDLFWKQLDLDYPGMPEAKVSMVFVIMMKLHSCSLRTL